MGLSSRKPRRPCAVSGRSPNFLRACRLTTSSRKRVASLGLGEGGAGLAVRGPVGRVRLPGVKQRAPSYPLGTGRVGLEPRRLQQLSPQARAPQPAPPLWGRGLTQTSPHPLRRRPCNNPPPRRHRSWFQPLLRPLGSVARFRPLAWREPWCAGAVRAAWSLQRRLRARVRPPRGERSDVTGPSRPGTPLRPGGHLPFQSPK